jgi:hypothetical protein
MTIGALAAGVRPEQVLPGAAAAIRRVAIVEASDLAVVSGSARVTVRFTGDDDPHANRVALHGIEGTKLLAGVLTWRVTRRDGGHWNPVAPA